MVRQSDKVVVELFGDVAELREDRRYEVQRERGRLLIVIDEPAQSGDDAASEALEHLDRYSGALNTGGELRRTVDALRDEWS